MSKGLKQENLSPDGDRSITKVHSALLDLVNAPEYALKDAYDKYKLDQETLANMRNEETIKKKIDCMVKLLYEVLVMHGVDPDVRL